MTDEPAWAKDKRIREDLIRAVEARVRAEVADLLWNMPHTSDVFRWLRDNHTCTSECEHLIGARAGSSPDTTPELAGERDAMRRVAERSHLTRGGDHWPDCPGCAINAILDVAGSERCGICGGHLTAGGCERHHDTTPEGRDG